MLVLLVEDDHELGQAVVAGLRAGGFAVDWATDVAEADLKQSVYSYDCVVLDRGLPDGDGLGLLRGWRSRQVRTPVLVLTALDAVPERIAGFADGADDYLGKPFAMEELVVRVGALCRRAEPPRETVLRVLGVEMDLPRRRVRRDGVLLSLTSKEFAVLELLLTRAGHVVSRSEFIEHCWDEMAEPMSNVVDVVVAQLRRKLGEPPLIGTARGVGFVLGPAG
ncbi:response regulator transcription factor [Lentzea nigeriaca]|uniref:response regulator transcription factor n=1 Tax=Lentzea nigeriaca TaxID=1128665 RepID=UPI00195CE109|nr:response regulator transcription factor [Lentzea nigeriaca]MBM7863646.1 two-component system copper resistance phosphate regulon response regulator CusR [Lentzea nigeriaca]